MMQLLKKRKNEAVAAKKVPARKASVWGGGILPGPVVTALKKVASRQLRVNWTECLVLLLGTASALLLVQSLADWFFSLPWVVRLFLLVMDLVLVGLIVKLFGWEPWKNRLNQETAALRVEKEVPSFRSSLISAVELSSAVEGGGHGSLDLIRELVSKVAVQIQREKVSGRVVKTSRLKKWSKWMLVAVLVTGLSAYFAGAKTPVLLKRVFLSNMPLPTRTIVLPITKDASVPIGSDIILSARALGEVPRNGRVQIIYADNERQDISVSGSGEEPDTFSITLRNVQQPFRYRFVLNDGSGPEFSVAAKTPPVLASFRCIQKYPGYTGRPELEMQTGNLSLMAGSRIVIEGESTQALKSAVIRLEGTNTEVPMKTSGKSIRGEFMVPKEGLSGISMSLVNEEDVASLENTVYRVEFIDDRAPVVELLLPLGERLSVLLKTKPKLMYVVKDDFGLKKIALKYEFSRPAPRGGSEPPPEKGEINLPLPAFTSSGTSQTYVWDLGASKPAWQEEGIVRYWIEAQDNNDVTGPGVGESERKALSIVSEEAKKAELLEKLGNIATELENVYNTQKKVNETLDGVIRKNQP